MKEAKNGFTIVELLIVIVVIAVLAAITVVAFNGIQLRARNSQTFSAVNTYYKALIAYASVNSTYPTVAANGVSAQGSCLGSDYPSNACWGAGAGQRLESAGLMSALGTTISRAPMPGLRSSVSAGQYRGVLFIPASSNWTLDGVARDWLLYAVEGSSTRCEAGTIASYISGLNLSSTPPVSGQTTNTLGTPTCWVVLPPA